jgi:hypothetical protein
MGGGSFVLIAAIAAVLNLVLFSGPRDRNPALVRLDTAADLFEVQNRSGENLWQIPIKNASHMGGKEQWEHTSSSQVADINGDGRNEVLTVVPFEGVGFVDNSYLRIFSADKTLLRQIKIGEPVRFVNIGYPDQFHTECMVLGDFSKSGAPEIIAVTLNASSPCLLARFDKNGKLLGEYWHFGHLVSIYAVDLNGDGKLEIVCCGTNDAAGDLVNRYGVVAVLDPSKIEGSVESVGSAGFGFPPSQAELYYIRFPRPDIENIERTSAVVSPMWPVRYENGDAFNFWYTMPSYEIALQYILSKQMRILGIVPTTGFEELHAKLVKEAKLKGKIDNEYLDSLSAGVRYWDGKEWRKEPVRVQHISYN